MAQLIQLNSENNGNYNIQLNGITYLLRAYWNRYVNRWSLDIKDIDDNPIAMGLTIVSSINLLQYRRQLAIDIGQLWAFDILGEDCINRDELGKNTILVYYAPGEFETTFPTQGDIDTRPFTYDFDPFFTPV